MKFLVVLTALLLSVAGPALAQTTASSETVVFVTASRPNEPGSPIPPPPPPPPPTPPPPTTLETVAVPTATVVLSPPEQLPPASETSTVVLPPAPPPPQPGSESETSTVVLPPAPPPPPPQPETSTVVLPPAPPPQPETSTVVASPEPPPPPPPVPETSTVVLSPAPQPAPEAQTSTVLAGPVQSTPPTPGPPIVDYPFYISPEGNCSVGFTYCGYALTELHNFTAQDISGAYSISGAIPANTVPDADHANNGVYLCRGDSAEPGWSSKIQLLCACKAQCYSMLPDYRAHCSSVCVSSV